MTATTIATSERTSSMAGILLPRGQPASPFGRHVAKNYSADEQSLRHGAEVAAVATDVGVVGVQHQGAVGFEAGDALHQKDRRLLGVAYHDQVARARARPTRDQ